MINYKYVIHAFDVTHIVHTSAYCEALDIMLPTKIGRIAVT